MSREFPERDWKVLRQVHPLALDRFCRRILVEVARLTSDESRGAHERYLALFELIKRRDKELAAAFNDMRRSRASLRLACIQSHGLLTEDELDRLSPETREAVALFTAGYSGDDVAGAESDGDDEG